MANIRSSDKLTSVVAPAQSSSAGDARKAALLRHAREQMLLHGVHNASLNEILRLAGGSKATLVKYFGSKAGLFSVVLAESVRDAISKITFDRASADSISLEEGVYQIVKELLKFYLTPEALATYRGLIATSGQKGNLANTFYESGHLVMVDEIATYLAHWRGRGLRADVDCRAAAGQLTHMARSGLYERALLGLQSAPFPPDLLEAAADQTARLFVAGIIEH